KAVNVLLATIAALLIFFAIVVADPVGGGVLGGIGAFCGLLLLINVLRGPTCHCWLSTAVQWVDLAALAPRRSARVSLGNVRPPQKADPVGFNPAFQGRAACGVGPVPVRRFDRRVVFLLYRTGFAGDS